MAPGLASITHIVSAATPAGVCATAALLMIIGNVDLSFCHETGMDDVNPDEWSAPRLVALVGLCADPEFVQSSTALQDFVDRLHRAGHRIVAVMDGDLTGETWHELLGEINFLNLLIKPRRDDGIRSRMGLGEVIYDSLDFLTRARRKHVLISCAEPMNAAQRNFNIATMISKVHPNVSSWCAYTARRFAEENLDDEQLQRWLDKYRAMISSTEKVIEKRVDLSPGVVLVSTVDQVYSPDDLIQRLYVIGAKVVISDRLQRASDRPGKVLVFDIQVRGDQLELSRALERHKEIFLRRGRRYLVQANDIDRAVRFVEQSLAR